MRDEALRWPMGSGEWGYVCGMLLDLLNNDDGGNDENENGNLVMNELDSRRCVSGGRMHHATVSLLWVVPSLTPKS